MAGTATVTESTAARSVKKYSVAWTSTAGGAVSANAFSVDPGYVVGVKFVPGTGGTVPSAAYDVTVVDADSVDVSYGAGANLSETAATISRIDPPCFLPSGSTLDVVVANAGNAKTGRVDIYIDGTRE